MSKPMTRKEWLAYLQKAVDEFDWDAAYQEQGEPVAYIHRNEYNEYRLEPHDNFDIKSIPFNVDVPLFKAPQPAQKPLTDEQIEQVENQIWNTDQLDEVERQANKEFVRAIEAAHGIKEKNNG